MVKYNMIATPNLVENGSVFLRYIVYKIRDRYSLGPDFIRLNYRYEATVLQHYSDVEKLN